MKQSEYEAIQEELSALMDGKKIRHKQMGFNAREYEAYKKAVLACKSVLSYYNPEKRGADAM